MVCKAVFLLLRRLRLEPVKNIRSAASRLIFGAPAQGVKVRQGNLPKRRALPLFGSDGLSSVAYAPDEILLTLLLAGHGALMYSPLVGLGIAIALLLVVGTYRYNIRWVGEKGDFALVQQKLGTTAAIVLGAALMVDFMLTVAVSLSSAAQYLESITPVLLGHQRLIACTLIALVTLLCLRGLAFMLRVSHLPAYIFLALLSGVILCGLVADSLGTLGPAPSADYRLLAPEDTATVLTTQLGVALLLVRAFASGSVALTGVNTISNAVKAFAPPRQRNAALSLMLMGSFSALTLLGALYLARQTGAVFVLDTQNLIINGQPAPPTFHQMPVLLQITQAIFASPLITTLMGLATIAVLMVAAMTAFTGFPLLATTIAAKQHLPIHFSAKGSATLYANGVLALGLSSMALVAFVGPDVHTLIQMYIVGVFTAMALTQYSVLRTLWKAQRLTPNPLKRRKLWRDLTVTTIGTLATGIVLAVVLLTKFTHGAWVTVLIIVFLTWLMKKTHQHYSSVDRQLALPENPDQLTEERALPARVHAIVYVEHVRKPALRALAYARASRPSTLEVITTNADPSRTQHTLSAWQDLALPVDLTVLDAPGKDATAAILTHLRRVQEPAPRSVIMIYLPEYITARRWQGIMHRRTVHKLKARLRHQPGIVIASVPWPLDH